MRRYFKTIKEPRNRFPAESIPPAYVAWRAGGPVYTTTYSSSVPKAHIDCYKVQALSYSCQVELSVPNVVLWTRDPGGGPSHRLHHDRCRPDPSAQERTGPVRRSEHRRRHLPLVQLCKDFFLHFSIFALNNV